MGYYNNEGWNSLGGSGIDPNNDTIIKHNLNVHNNNLNV